MLPNQAPPRGQQALTPFTCAENPIFFNGTDISEAFLNSHAINHHHSATINPCANTNAHRNLAGQPTPYHVCSTCRTQALAHITATAPHLLSYNTWPLCPFCSRHETRNPVHRPASCVCDTLWLCYACRHQQLELAAVRGEVEGNLLVNVKKTSSNTTENWICRCDQTVVPFTGMKKCAGCGFLARGGWGVDRVMQRARAYVAGLGWT
jgi:hypothetical protein